MPEVIAQEPMSTTAEAGGRVRRIDLSVVMPCLNEADTLEDCIQSARRGLEAAGVTGEIVVADNGSTDGSREIAERMGARVIPVERRGYGSALMGGIAAARGDWVIMGDADMSYDFGEIPAFVSRLRDGHDLVQGCRLPSGGGTVMQGAMPFLHRWWGNPMFSFLARWWFRVPTHDIHCGMRGFKRDFAVHLDQRCTGMEFASEMIIKATLARADISEVPITLHPDQRVSHSAHLRTFRDGWRHLRFFFMYSPRWLFQVPGTLLIVFGCLASIAGLLEAQVGTVRFAEHTTLMGAVAIVLGYQTLLFAIFATVFGMVEGFLPPQPRMERLFEVVKLERGLLVGALSLVLGLAFILVAVNEWRLTGFSDLDYSRTMPWVIPGSLFVILGFQTVISSFFLSILGMRRI